ncbi:hypothetical protein ACFY0Z_30125 [Streptomyces kronopolitis]|uniref:hypothetical protein n=1 Tax=Streptomyces kronopolitis TaxID=1612435 RepID=UPI0036A14E1B
MNFVLSRTLKDPLAAMPALIELLKQAGPGLHCVTVCAITIFHEKDVTHARFAVPTRLKDLEAMAEQIAPPLSAAMLTTWCEAVVIMRSLEHPESGRTETIQGWHVRDGAWAGLSAQQISNGYAVDQDEKRLPPEPGVRYVPAFQVAPQSQDRAHAPM